MTSVYSIYTKFTNRVQQEQPLRQKMMEGYKTNNHHVDDDIVQEEQPLIQKMIVEYKRNKL